MEIESEQAALMIEIHQQSNAIFLAI